MTLCRATSLHIPPDSDSSSIISALICHSLPLSIMWTAKHRIYFYKVRKCSPNHKLTNAWTYYSISEKPFRQAWKKNDGIQMDYSADISPIFPLVLWGKCLLSHGCINTFFPPTCDHSGESGTFCNSGRMAHWGTAAGKASALPFQVWFEPLIEKARSFQTPPQSIRWCNRSLLNTYSF